MSRPDLIPTRHTLVDETVRIMAIRINAREWQTYLPGERQLASTLQVGRDTIRLVLEILESKNMILPAERGKRRQINPAKVRNGSSSPELLKIGLLAPVRLERMQQTQLLEIDQIREALANRNGSLHLHVPNWYHQRKPERGLEELVSQEHCTAWLLLRSTDAVQQWFDTNKVPALIRGYPHPGVELPFLDVDWEATARHAAGRLWRLGHRRIGILVPPGELSGAIAAVTGADTLKEEGFEVIQIAEDGTTESVCRGLEESLRSTHPPSALIATRPRQAATALTWLATHRIRVPQDLSLITLAHETFLDHLVPAIPGYRTNPESVAKRVLRKLDSLQGRSKKASPSTWLSPDVIDGSSIAAPRKSGR